MHIEAEGCTCREVPPRDMIDLIMRPALEQHEARVLISTLVGGPLLSRETITRGLSRSGGGQATWLQATGCRLATGYRLHGYRLQAAGWLQATG